MDVLGRDAGREAYRVAIWAAGRRIEGWVPEALIAEGLARPDAPRHRSAYEWLAIHRDRIETALLALTEGRAPPSPPFNRILLAEER